MSTDFAHKYHLCYADIQTNGRGQRGGKWVSNNTDNIYSTLGFKCNFNISDVALSSIKIALGVLEGIKNYLPCHLQKHLKIKLPNDIYFKDFKLAGILIETKNIKKDNFDIVIGVGINVNMTCLLEDIDREWISLAIIRGEECNSSLILADVVPSIVNSFFRHDNTALANFKKYDYLHNKMITFNSDGDEYVGMYKGVSENLDIILESDVELCFNISTINKVRRVAN